jgi:zinc transporter 1/2/3
LVHNKIRVGLAFLREPKDYVVTLAYYKTSAALLIFLVSIVTSFYLLKKKSALRHPEAVELGEALASGIFLGIAFFHMLPEAIRLFGQVYNTVTYPIPEAICLAGFLLMLFLERLSITASAQHTTLSIPYILTLILVIHALIEGAALGVGATIPEAAMLFIAILAHKGSESFALCVTMLKHELPLPRIVIFSLFFALMSPIGIALGMMINEFTYANHGTFLAATFDAFAAGTFIYISTLHHIRFHKHTEETQGMLEFGCLVLGLVAMAVIALWV